METGNCLTVFAQSDDEENKGQIVATAYNGNAGIGGRAGEDGAAVLGCGEKGKPAGDFCQKGGKVTVTTTDSTCIGGGNGGAGGKYTQKGGMVVFQSDSFHCIGGGEGGLAAISSSRFNYYY